MCLFFILLIFGPRVGLMVWWLMDQARFQEVFSGYLWMFLGFFFLPWTTMSYVLVAPNGISGFDWLWLGFGLLIDLSSLSSSAYKNRDKIPHGSKSSAPVVESV